MADNYTLHPGWNSAHIKRNGRTIAVLPEPCTKAEADAMLAAVQRLGREVAGGFVHTSNGPTKPPYGSPERKILGPSAFESSLSKAQQRKGTA